MSDGILKPIAPITLSQLPEKRLEDFPTLLERYEYTYWGGTEWGQLFDLTGNNKQIRISEHFTAGEFAVSGAQRFDFARIHEDLVNELEKIRVFFNLPVKIATGYMSQTPWKNKVTKLEIEEHHLGGLAARIKIAGVPPYELAKYAIIVGEKHTSVSVGKDDVIIAVKQEQPKIYSHIGEGSGSGTRSRVSRENAIKALQFYHNFFQLKYRANLGKLEDHYRSLRFHLIQVIPKIQRGFYPGHYPSHVEEHKEIILNLFQNHQLTDEAIIILLFYSDYFTLFRAYLRLEDTFKDDPQKKNAFEYYAVEALGEILCPGLKSVRAQQRNTRNRILPIPSRCTNFPDEIKLPLTLHDKDDDKKVIEYLASMINDVLRDKRQASHTQQGVVLGANKNENYVDKPKPDNPKYDITGRYEVVTTHHNFLLGQTLAINQAGLHIQGVHSWVYQPPPPRALTNQERGIFRFSGDLKGDTYKGFYHGKQYSGHYIDLVRKNDSTLLVDVIYPSGFVEKLEFVKTDSRATNLSLDVARGTELVRRYEWAPLLSVQLSNISDHFYGSKLNKFDKLLNNYWNPNSINDPEGEQRKIAGELSAFFKAMFSKRDRGVHRHDAILTSFYLSAVLTERSWAPIGYDKLTRYDYLVRMIEQEQLRKFAQGDVFTVREYLNLPQLDENVDPDKFVYEIELKLYGRSATIRGVGGQVFKGTMKIEKKEGEGHWDIGLKAKYSVLVFGPVLGKGGNNSISGKSNFKAPIEWIPSDFSGWGDFTMQREGFSAARVSGSETRGIIIADLPRGTFRMEFITRSISPTKPGKPSASGEISINKIRIGEADKVDKPLILNPTEINKDYAIQYSKNARSFNGFNSAVLTEDARNLLRLVCASELPILLEKHIMIRIEGYADQVGTQEYNHRLALNRAKNVKQAMLDILGNKLGIDPDDIDLKSFGESVTPLTRSVNPEENPEYRGVRVFINGRVVLTLQDSYI